MYSEKLESLIDAILADGKIEDNEMAVLKRAAEREGEDPDEIEIIVKGRLAKMQRSLASANAESKPQNPVSNKFGNVMKCPSCGAQIVGGSAKCPECGYNFSGIKANSSATKLAQELQRLTEKENEKRQEASGLISGLGKMYGSMFSQAAKTFTGERDPKVVLVENFPVPNTREDLLEFLTSIQTKAKKPTFFTKGSTHLAMDHAYWHLYSNCINKARISYANDPDFRFFFEDYMSR